VVLRDCKDAPGVSVSLDPDALRRANINPATGLATDFLNRYNEVAMLLGLLADMPEAAEDILAWRPCTYEEHFASAGFRDRELAAAAYAASPADVRRRFAASCAAVESVIAEAQAALAAGTEGASAAAGRAAALFDLIAQAGGVINGAAARENPGQREVDTLFA
jgi:hypothetical protein